MKIFRLYTVVMMALMSGCIKVDETLTLEKNGSGNLELIYAIPEQTVSQMKSMFKLREQMDTVLGHAMPRTIEDEFEQVFFDPSEDRIKLLVKKYEKLGITMDTLKVETRNAVRNVTLKVAFADLGEVARADFFPRHGFSLFRNNDDTYTFSRLPDNDETILKPRGIAPESAGLLSPVLSGFRVALKVNTPGKIFESNASRKALYNAAWIFDFDKDPNAVETLQNQSMKIIFDGKGSKLPEVRQLAKSTNARTHQR
ncbi:MAG: hypothetical protein A2283_19825 [Lentisphaerae bacterium RIFOXYA12_FULL_48_11]|nr:MAG: hypothetical protein A2283_19825 [Lentisphaerae bacterium RIFOXYA12_FULL_48_11]